MPTHYKAFIVVILMTAITFTLAKPLFTRFMAVADYVRRRNVWLVLTVATFLVPHLWVFMLAAAVIIGWAASKERNVVALYLFLILVTPPITLELGGMGAVSQLFRLDHIRLLSLVVLLPAACRMLVSPPSDNGNANPRTQGQGALLTADVLVVLYAVLQLLLMFPSESLTASLRRLFLLSIDILLPYFVISRSLKSRESLVEAMAAFALSALIVAPLAVFEYGRGWLLFEGLDERWGIPRINAFLLRGDSLRAQVTAGHSIVLGNAMAIGIGLWLYLDTRLTGVAKRWLVLGALSAALIASFARGPWVGAVGVVLAFVALGPNPWQRSAKVIGSLALVGLILMITPYAGKVIAHLPFIGTMSDETVEYRQRLAEVSWQLIRQNPFFGSRTFGNYMQDLKQGEGIIDLVNAYADVALNFGLVGLGLFVGVFLVNGGNALRASRRFIKVDADFAAMGAGLLAAMVGSLLIAGTTSNYLSVPALYWAMGALSSAYARIAKGEALCRSGLPRSGPLSMRPMADGAR